MQHSTSVELPIENGGDHTHAPVQEPAGGEKYGTIEGAVRFGDGACIGNGYYMSAHGGSIETALDEATAELVSASVLLSEQHPVDRHSAV